MFKKQSEVIVVGGGLAGSALSISLSRAGMDVLLLEAEATFRDRVRGEILFPWGVAEARRLGIDEFLQSAGAHPLPFRDTYVGGVLRKRNPFAEESSIGLSPLTFNHVAVQEKLINAARDLGVHVERGAKVEGLLPGTPGVSYTVEGRSFSASAQLVVGADGKTSRIRQLGGFEVSQGSQGLMTTGVALAGVSIAGDSMAVAFNKRDRESAALLPQTGGRVRAYLTFHGTPDRTGPLNLEQLIRRLVAAGLPADAFGSASVVGPLATFDGTPKWVEVPYQDGVALIGDSASTPDPAFGQGMALALRDVQILTNALVETASPSFAGLRYAEEHSAYAATNRFVSGILGEAQFHEGACADQLRSSDLWGKSAGRLRKVHLDGPDDLFQDLLIPLGDVAREELPSERISVAC